MLNHVAVGTNDLDRSARFYDAVLRTLGVGAPVRGKAASGHSRLIYRHNGTSLVVTQPINGEAATAANGGTIGFKCTSPEQVRSFFQAAISCGGTAVEGPPVPHETATGATYAAYVRDPDGNKLCAIYRPE